MLSLFKVLDKIRNECDNIYVYINLIEELFN